MKRSISLLLTLLILLGTPVVTASRAGAVNETMVRLRIEGRDETLYDNGGFAAPDGAATLQDVMDGYNSLDGTEKITFAADDGAVRISRVGALGENSIGGSVNDRWMVRLNGKNIQGDFRSVQVQTGDEIVIYYADPALIQYPIIHLDRMITDGIVRFIGGNGGPEDPITGATVVWDGMTYVTDKNGEIIIDSTGTGVAHTVSIERYHESGLPTVLRLPRGYAVKYGFRDVLPASWYYKDVMYISEQKLLKGVSESEFAPDTPMNRAMFVTVLGRLTGAEVSQSAAAGFPDVTNDGWSAGYIAWAAEKGIVGGYANGMFGQYDPVTREQLAVILSRYAQSSGIDGNLPDTELTAFGDAAGVSSYALPSVKWAVGKGIITGSDGRLDPQKPATRAQVAAMLRRFIDAYGLVE